MRKILILFIFIFTVSCASLAPYTHADPLQYFPIYGINSTYSTPPLDTTLNIGESYIWYWGDVDRYKIRKGVTYITINKDGYPYFCSVLGKVEIRNDSKCYMLRENVDGEIIIYLICENKKYELL